MTESQRLKTNIQNKKQNHKLLLYIIYMWGFLQVSLFMWKCYLHAADWKHLVDLLCKEMLSPSVSTHCNTNQSVYFNSQFQISFFSDLLYHYFFYLTIPKHSKHRCCTDVGRYSFPIWLLLQLCLRIYCWLMIPL